MKNEGNAGRGLLGQSPADEPATFRSVSLALEPFACLYLSAGLGAVQFTTAVKLAFIRAAARNCTTRGKLNVSAVSVATGLTRKEIRSLLDIAKNHKTFQLRNIAQQRTTRVIQGWRTDPAFLDRAGNPAKLPIRGREKSLEALVRRYAGDVTPISVATELERTGAITIGRRKLAKLSRIDVDALSSKQDTLIHMAARVGDLASTLSLSSESDKSPTFTGFREAKSLPPEIAAIFLKTFTERSAMLLESVDRWFALQPKQRHPTKAADGSAHRVGIGVYLVDDPAGSRKPLPPRRPHRRKPKPPLAT
jgi:hypothetical protein